MMSIDSGNFTVVNDVQPSKAPSQISFGISVNLYFFQSDVIFKGII